MLTKLENLIRIYNFRLSRAFHVTLQLNHGVNINTPGRVELLFNRTDVRNSTAPFP